MLLTIVKCNLRLTTHEKCAQDCTACAQPLPYHNRLHQEKFDAGPASVYYLLIVNCKIKYAFYDNNSEKKIINNRKHISKQICKEGVTFHAFLPLC